jgi:hypothetical protein
VVIAPHRHRPEWYQQFIDHYREEFEKQPPEVKAEQLRRLKEELDYLRSRPDGELRRFFIENAEHALGTPEKNRKVLEMIGDTFFPSQRKD